MAKYCTGCGRQIKEGVTFCTECGTKVPAESLDETIRPVHTGNAQSNTHTHHTSQRPEQSDHSDVISTGTYFGLMLLFAIPVIGIIACIVMAFVPKNKNIRNFAKAMLIWLIIAAVIAGIVSVAVTLITNSLLKQINELSGEQFKNFGDVFGHMEELMEQFGEQGELQELLQNLDKLKDLPVE